MPYITDQNRGKVDPRLQPLLEHVASDSSFDAGHLNYVLTRILSAYVEGRGLRYVQLNAAVGALECAKMEMYRRVAAPYEDRKIHENGDAYPGVLTADAPIIVRGDGRRATPQYGDPVDEADARLESEPPAGDRATDDGMPPAPPGYGNQFGG